MDPNESADVNLNPNEPTHVKKPARLMAAKSAAAIALGLVSVAAVAMLTSGREPAPSANVSTVEAQPQEWTATEPTVKPQESAVAEPTVNTAPMAHRQTTKTDASKAPAASVLPAKTLMADATVAEAPNARPTSDALVEEPARVTITGCLEHDDERFRLKDTTGADAPKSRSWKSGFLKKRSASLEVVAAGKRVELPNHVGHRVSLTGVLQDREMQVHSVRRLAASCD